MRQIFNDSQHSHRANQAIESMLLLAGKEQCRSNPPFLREFGRNMLIILATEPDSPYTKWAFEFLTQFIIKQTKSEIQDDLDKEQRRPKSKEKADPLMTTFDLLLKNFFIPALRDTNINIRINSCALLRRILSGIDDIVDTVYTDLRKTLVEGMANKHAVIRAATIKTLHRFQDREDPSDVVNSAFAFHLENDPDYKVRQAVLMVIEPGESINEKILARIRDVKDTVRKTAYAKIAERINISNLTMEQRLTIIREGLNDRNSSVRKTVEKQLIFSWVKACDENLISLLTLFDIEPDPESVEKMLKVIFKAYLSQKQDGKTKLHFLVQQFKYQFLDDRKLLLKQPLTVENAFLWRSLAVFCKEHDLDPLVTDSNQDSNKDDLEGEMEQYEKIIDEMLVKMQLKETARIIQGDEESAASTPATIDSEVQSTSSSEQQNDPTGPTPPKKSKTVEQVEMDLVDLILPQLPHFCIYLRKFAMAVDKAECDEVQLTDYDFIYDQLIQILLLLEVGDAAQQNILLNAVNEIVMLPNLSGKLTNVISPLVKVLSQNFFKSCAQLLDFVQSLTQKIHNSIFDAEVDPAPVSQASQEQPVELTKEELREIELSYAKVCVDLEDVRDAIEAAITDQDFMQAETLKHKRLELEKEKDSLMAKRMNARGMGPTEEAPVLSQKVDANITHHPLLHIKCLQLFTACLEFGNFNEINSVIQSHIDRFCFSGFLSEETYIRQLSVKALALVALIDASFATKYFGLFIQAIQLDEDSVRNLALQSLIDLICQHGINDPDNQSNGPDFSEKLSDLIIEVLRSKSDVVRLSAVKGVAKLLFLGRISSSTLLTRLLIMWYDERLTEEIRQFLGSWFPLFAFSDSRVRNSLSGQVAFEETFLPTLECAFKMSNKGEDSFEEDDFELPQHKVENLMSFMINLMNENVQPKVALAVCHKILDLFEKPDDDLFRFEDRVLCKCLQSLSVISATKAQLKELKLVLKKVVELAEEDPDRLSQNSLKKVKKVLDKVQEYLDQLKDEGNCSQLTIEQNDTHQGNETGETEEEEKEDDEMREKEEEDAEETPDKVDEDKDEEEEEEEEEEDEDELTRIS